MAPKACENNPVMSVLDLTNTLSVPWQDLLQNIMKEEAQKVDARIAEDETIGFEVYPPRSMVFAAFQHTQSPSDVKVCIIGQDCYHGEGQANGLCFSVNRGLRMPPSLRNIFAEVERSFGIKRTDTDLTDWAQQGVLLLNRALTVRQASPNSHKKEWHAITEAVVCSINNECKNIVFMLWGDDARKCTALIDTSRHCVLEHTHPSPLSRKPFVGNGHFVRCNEYLESVGKTPIKWA